MMTDKTVKYNPEDCIASLFASELASLDQDRLALSSIILPNKRLEVALCSVLTRLNPVSFFPGTFSLDEYLQEMLVSHHAESALVADIATREIISPLAAELCLANILDSSSYKHLKIGHEHELSVFYGALIQNRLSSSWYDSLTEIVELDQVKSEVSLGIVRERLDEVRDVFERFECFLDERLLTTSARRTLSLVNAFESLMVIQNTGTDFESTDSSTDSSTGSSDSSEVDGAFLDDLFQGRSTYFFGFTTIQPIYKNVLKSLNSSQFFKLRLCDEVPLFSHQNPLRSLWGVFDEGVSERYFKADNQQKSLLGQKVFGRAEKTDQHPSETMLPEDLESNNVENGHWELDHNFENDVQIIRAADVVDEVELALKLAEESLKQGLSPHEIGILVSDEKTYAPVIRSLVDRLGFGLNVAVPISLSETSVGELLRNLKDFMFSEQTPTCLFKLLSDDLVSRYLYDVLGSVGSVGSAALAGSDNIPRSDSLQNLGIGSRGQLVEALSGFLNNLDLNKSIWSEPSNVSKCGLLERSIEVLSRLFAGMLSHGFSQNTGAASVDSSRGDTGAATNPDPKAVTVANIGARSQGVQSLEHFRQLKLGVYELLEKLPDASLGVDILSSIRDGLDSLFSSFEYSGISADHADPRSSDGFYLKTLSWLAEKAAMIPVRGVGYPLKGVQIMSVVESRFIPFRHVILCGCNEGDFPKSLPTDVLVDQYYKNRLGLPSWAYVESMEDTTFTLLLRRVDKIHLLYSEAKSFNSTVRSRFIDRVLLERPQLKELSSSDELKAKPIIGIGCFREDTQEPANIPESLTGNITALNRAKESEEAGQISEPSHLSDLDYHYGGDLAALFWQISPTSLERLLNCPLKFLLSKLKLAPVNNLEDQQALYNGNWIHRVFEEYLEAFSKDLSLREPHAREKMNGLMERILVSAQKAQPLDDSLYYQLSRKSFPQFVDWFGQLLDKTQNYSSASDLKIYSELDIGPLKKRLPVFSDKFELSLVGRIDACFQVGNQQMLLDFKTNTTPKKGDIDRGLIPQLLLYAFALDENDQSQDNQPTALLSTTLVAYWKVLDSKLDISAAGTGFRTSVLPEGSIPKKLNNIEDILSRLFQLTDQRLTEIAATSRFAPEKGKGCDFCDYSGICKKDDPRFEDHFKEPMFP